MSNIVFDTYDYSNWPDWLLKCHIKHLERDISLIDKKIKEEMTQCQKDLENQKKKTEKYERHKHLLDKLK